MEKDPLENVLSVKCHLHPSNPSDVLHLAPDAANHRACIRCVLKGDVTTLAALDIMSLFQMAGDEDSILSYYPPLGDLTIYQRLESIQQYSVDKMIELIVQKIGDMKLSFE